MRTRKASTGFRAAHGRARELGRLVVLESPPVDELRPAMTCNAAPPERDASGRFLPGNKAGTAQRVKAGKRGALVHLERQGDAAARAAVAFGRRYSAHRRAELARLHGGMLSSGPGSMIESASMLLASSRYWAARASAEGNPDFARLSATLAAGARQAERDAWHLAQLEAQARPKSPASYPWLVSTSTPAQPDDESNNDNDEGDDGNDDLGNDEGESS